jgi:energy-coupling factor transporter ATP-binding protein EcfA2
VNHLLLAFDRFWCDKTQLPASLITSISDHITVSFRLARLRFLIACCVALQIVGTFFITVGLFSWEPVEFLILGILLKIFGGLFSSWLQNRAGVLWSLELQDCLKNLKTHSQEISALLAEKGCSEAEIHTIHNLPNEVYQSELNSYKQASLLNIFNPLACGIALLLNGEITTGAIVVILGLLSFPIGEYFFRKHTYRHEAELRLGRSAGLTPYLKRVYDEHVALTLQVNALSQLPLLLFGARFLWSSSGQLLAIFFGIVQGLVGLTGTLAFQRSRVSALRSTMTAHRLIDILNWESFLITPKRWREHILRDGTVPLKEMRGLISEGVAFVNFSSRSLSSHAEAKPLPSITCTIPRHGACILQAPSGRGKSTFLAAVLHLIEHDGGFFLVSDGKWNDAHHADREKFDSSLLFVKEENIGKSARIVDLFSKLVAVKLAALQTEMRLEFGLVLTDLAWKTSDNLVEHEIHNIKNRNQSVFPAAMYSKLIQMRKERSTLVDGFCKNAGGNLATTQISPERVFASLSSGERRRLICALSYETAKVFDQLKLIILDEPLAHLDSHSIDLQMQTMGCIQKLPHAPPMLIISHHHIAEFSKHLTNAKVLTF